MGWDSLGALPCLCTVHEASTGALLYSSNPASPPPSGGGLQALASLCSQDAHSSGVISWEEVSQR